jgi:hypothetical protein
MSPKAVPAHTDTESDTTLIGSFALTDLMFHGVQR